MNVAGEELIYALEEKLYNIDRDNNYYDYICTKVILKEAIQKRKKFIDGIKKEKKGEDLTYVQEAGDLEISTSKVSFWTKFIRNLKKLFGFKKKADRN
ncbi:MAG: hypothetical protein RR594_06925 [Clostridia bacterium]